MAGYGADVYKRQLQSNGLPINPQTWNYTKVDDEYKNRDNRMNNQLMAVSYTHLDVYKRQAYMFAVSSPEGTEAIKTFN